MTATVTCRLTLDSVLKMATAAAQKHADALPDDRKANSELSQAVAATWELIRGRLGSFIGVRYQFIEAQAFYAAKRPKATGL